MHQQFSAMMANLFETYSAYIDFKLDKQLIQIWEKARDFRPLNKKKDPNLDIVQNADSSNANSEMCLSKNEKK